MEKNLVPFPTKKINPTQVLSECINEGYDNVVVFGFKGEKRYQIRSSYSAERLELIGMIWEMLDHFTRSGDLGD